MGVIQHFNQLDSLGSIDLLAIIINNDLRPCCCLSVIEWEAAEPFDLVSINRAGAESFHLVPVTGITIRNWPAIYYFKENKTTVDLLLICGSLSHALPFTVDSLT